MNKLEVCIEACKKLSNKNIAQRTVSGNLPAEDYFDLKEKLEQYGWLISNDDENHYIETRLSPETDQLFVFDVNDLLTAPSRHLRAPANFYVADLDYLHKEDHNSETPVLITQYLNTVKLASAFISIADHTVKGPLPKAIFLLREKLELSLKYDQDDLKPLEGLDRFIADFVNADIHKDQKAAIIKNVLLDMLSNNRIDRLTLPCVIRRFDEFLDRVSANYQLYVSEFSFEKIKSQVQQEKFDLTLKLNKVFSDIQNQLLAVPIALIVAGSQMSNKGEITAQNFFILIGTLIFGLFMFLLVRNQSNTLQAIDTEITFQWGLIKDKHAAAKERLEENHNKLKARHAAQRKVLRVIWWVVLFSVVSVTLLFLYFSGIFTLPQIDFLKTLCLTLNPTPR